MKCPKCSYTSFDYLQECKKCGEILDGSRKTLNLKMGVPTMFADIGNRVEELNDFDKPVAETTFVDTQNELPENGLLLGNEFSVPVANNLDTPPEVDLNIENELELGGLGSMNSMEPRTESEFELAQEENIVLDEIELSPTFSDEPEPVPELTKNDSSSLDDSGADLFAELDLDMDDGESLDDLLADLEKKD